MKFFPRNRTIFALPLSIWASLHQKFCITVGVCHMYCVFDSPWNASRASSALPLLVGENGSFEFSLPCLIYCADEWGAAYGLVENFMFTDGAAAFAFAIFCLTLAKGTCDFLRKSSSMIFFLKLFRLSPIFFDSEFCSFTAIGYTVKLQAWSRFSNLGLFSATDIEAARLPCFGVFL